MIMKICRFRQILPGFEHSGYGSSHMDAAGLAEFQHGIHSFHCDALGFAQVPDRPCYMVIRVPGDQDSCSLIPGNGLLGLLHTDYNRRTVFYVCEKPSDGLATSALPSR